MAKHARHRSGGWLPANHTVLESWLARKIEEVEYPTYHDEPLHPVLQDFKIFIEGDSVIYMGFHEMFTQVPHKPPYSEDPTGKPQVECLAYIPCRRDAYSRFV